MKPKNSDDELAAEKSARDSMLYQHVVALTVAGAVPLEALQLAVDTWVILADKPLIQSLIQMATEAHASEAGQFPSRC